MKDIYLFRNFYLKNWCYRKLVIFINKWRNWKGKIGFPHKQFANFKIHALFWILYPYRVRSSIIQFLRNKIWKILDKKYFCSFWLVPKLPPVPKNDKKTEKTESPKIGFRICANPATVMSNRREKIEERKNNTSMYTAIITFFNIMLIRVI